MNRIFVALISLFALASCAFFPPHPEALPPVPAPPVEDSRISIPIDVTVSSVREEINRLVPVELFRASGIRIGSLSKNTNIQDMERDNIEYALLVEVYLKISAKLMAENGLSQSVIAENIAKSREEIANSNPQILGRFIDGTYQLIVTRRAINLDFGPNTFLYGIPLIVEARADWRVCIGFWYRGKCRGIVLKHHEDARVETNSSFSTEIFVEEDWKVRAKTTGKVKVTLAYITVGPFRISFRGLAQRQIDRVIAKIIPKLNNLIEESAQIRPFAERVWPEIPKARSVSEDPKVWLQIVPTEFEWGGISKPTSDVARFGVGLKGQTNVHIDDQPNTLPITPLPRIVTRSPTGEFSMSLPVTVDFDYASKEITKRVEKLRFGDPEKAELLVSSVNLYGNGKNIVGAVHFSLHPKGWWIFSDVFGIFYIFGTPSYNPETGEVSIEDLQFDIRTEELALRYAAGLLYKPLLRELSKSLRVSIKADLDKLKKLANERLSNISLGEFAVLKSQIRTFNLNSIYVEENTNLGGHFMATGNGRLVID